MYDLEVETRPSEQLKLFLEIAVAKFSICHVLLADKRLTIIYSGENLIEN